MGAFPIRLSEKYIKIINLCAQFGGYTAHHLINDLDVEYSLPIRGSYQRVTKLPRDTKVISYFLRFARRVPVLPVHGPPEMLIQHWPPIDQREANPNVGHRKFPACEVGRSTVNAAGRIAMLGATMFEPSIYPSDLADCRCRYGLVAGAGMSLVVASDIIIAVRSAVFSPHYARLGLIPDAGVTFHLPRRIGDGRSLAKLLLAESIDASTALDWGLVYAVVPDADVLGQADAIARRLARGPSGVLSHIRSLQAATYETSFMEQLRSERTAQEVTMELRESYEGVSALFERREPDFSHHMM